MKATLIEDYGPRAFGIHHKLFACEPGGPFPELVIASASPDGDELLALLGLRRSAK